MANQKQTKKEINLCNVTIQLDGLTLDCHPKDIKMGNKTQKRIIKLDNYIQSGGIIKAPIHKWMYGWLKGLFKSKSSDTTVYLPDKMDAFSIGTAKDILLGRTEEQWDAHGEQTVIYELSPELEPYNLWPYHNYVSEKGKSGSFTKYFYKCKPALKPVPLEIYSTIPPSMIIDNMKNLGKVYGIGPKADGYRLGTFSVLNSKVVKIGEILL